MYYSLEGTVISKSQTKNTELPNYAEVVLPLLRSVRSIILSSYGAGAYEEKPDMTVVTAIDQEVERKITKGLKQAYPEIGCRGEEYGRSGDESTYWLLDLIDGTENYIRGLAGFGTILGLVQDDEIVFAALYDPLTDAIYWADKQRGAWKNDEKITVSNRSIERSMIHADVSEDPELQKSATVLLKSCKAKIIRLHGSAWRSMLIAEGKLDGLILYKAGGGDWDYAPTVFVCRMAGAIVRYFDTQQELASRSFSVLPPSVDMAIGAEIERICVAPENR